MDFPRTSLDDYNEQLQRREFEQPKIHYNRSLSNFFLEYKLVVHKRRRSKTQWTCGKKFTLCGKMKNAN